MCAMNFMAHRIRGKRGRPVRAPDQSAHRGRVRGRRLRVEICDGLVAGDEDVGRLLGLGRILEAGHRDIGRQLRERRIQGGEQVVQCVQVLLVAQTAQRRRSDCGRDNRRRIGGLSGIAAIAPGVDEGSGPKQGDGRQDWAERARHGNEERYQARQGATSSRRAS